MKKKYSFLLLLMAVACLTGTGYAQQKCATDEMYRIYKKRYPQIEQYEQQLNEEIRQTLSKVNPRTVARITSGDTTYYDIPVVIHVMHDYGNELVSDNAIFGLIAEMNKVYSLQNDTSAVIQPFKKYVGKANIRFHLATKDPLGQPTKGITHRFTYLTFGGDDQVKMDLWSPANYYNIWIENRIGAAVTGGEVLAYANFPTAAATYPFNDGVIVGYQFIDFQFTVEHETGHYFNLYHPWNSSNADCGVSCGDDEVDDTPPTLGHPSTCPLYDSTCATNYYKIYTSISGTDSVVNYPDTTNVQNIMDYSSCPNMFTIQQVARMHAALNSDIGKRDSLWSANNLSFTGGLNPTPDLPPVTDFAVKGVGGNTLNVLTYFIGPNTGLRFYNESWNDTLTAVSWKFSNGATVDSVTYGTAATLNSVVQNSFSTPGWVSVTLSATGNNSGTTTTTYPRAVFVADATATPAQGYYQEFSGSDTAKWPMFNYYNNEFKWERANVGFVDNYSIKYDGFDSRLDPATGLYPPTGSPNGDYDDLFSVPFDLTSFSSGACYLNFYYSGESRSSLTDDINDVLEIDYSLDKGLTWTLLDTLTKDRLDNKGASSAPYTPTSPVDWAPMAIPIPTAARTAYALFRFRYKPNVGNSVGIYGSTEFYPLSSGNNYYLDRINFSAIPASVSSVAAGTLDVAIAPNPTAADAYVIIKDAGNSMARVVVTDITGKVVYTTAQQITSSEQYIHIPHSAISVQGVYIVQTTTGNLASTQKLVVE